MKQWWSLAGYEWKKLWKRKSVWFTLGIMAAWLIAMDFGSMADRMSTGETVTGAPIQSLPDRKTYARALSGRLLDDQLLTEMKESPGNVSIGPYAAVYEAAQGFTRGTKDSLTMDEEGLYQARKETQKLFFEAYRLSKAEQSYWEGQEAKMKIPIEYGYADGWQKLVCWDMYMIGLLVIFMTAICVPGIFTEEHSRGTDQVILCTRFGRKKLYYAKVFAGSLFAVGSGWCLLAVSVICKMLIYGPDGFHTPLQLAVSQYGLAISIGGAFLITFMLLFFVSLLTGALAMFLAEWIQKWAAVLAIIIAAASVMRLVNLQPFTEVLRWISQFWSYLPANLLHEETLFDLRLLSFPGFKLTVWQFTPFLYTILTVVFIMAGKRIYCRFQAGGR